MTAEELSSFFKKGTLNLTESYDEKNIFYSDIGLIYKNPVEQLYDSAKVTFFYNNLDDLKSDYETFENSKEIQDTFVLEYAKVYKSENKNKFVEHIDLIN